METLNRKFNVNKFWILVLFLTLIELMASCHGVESRPNFPMSPTENKGNNSVTYNKDEYFKKFWKQHNGGLCPFGQVLQRNNTICCVVKSCAPGYEIEECRSNGAEDKCSKCKDNFIQLHTISSLNMEDAKCFPVVKDHENCPGRMNPARNMLHPKNFPYPCECVFDKCFVEDDVGDCTIRVETICGRNYEMNRITGLCELCPWYSYKHVNGCEPCTINETLLRQGKPGGIFIPPELRTTTVTTSVQEISSKENPALSTIQDVRGPYKKTDELHIVYIFLGVLGVIVFLIVVAVTFICYKRNRPLALQSAPPTPSADNAPLLPGQVIPTPTANDYGNILYQPNNHSLPETHDINRNIHGNYNHINNNNPGNGYVTDNVSQGHKFEIDQNRDLNRTFIGMERVGRLNGAVANGVLQTDVNRRIYPQLNELDLPAYPLPADRDNKVKESQNNNKRKLELQEAAFADQTDGIEPGQGETDPSESDIDKRSDNKLELSRNVKRSTKYKENALVSIHGNAFRGCNITIGTPVGHGNTKVKGIIPNQENLTSISGTFEIDTSLKSEDFVADRSYSDQTLKQPGRRNGNQNELKLDGVLCGHEDQICRPELGGGGDNSNIGSNLQKQEVKLDTVQKYPGQEREEGKVETVEEQDIKPESEGSPVTEERTVPRLTVAPFQNPAPISRPVGRVPPFVRQNSGVEVRHVSGYPSSRISDEDSASSIRSMSYAIMHMDSGLSNGYISRNVANVDELSEVDENERQQLQSAIYDDVQANQRVGPVMNGLQRQLDGNEHSFDQVREMQLNLNAPPLTRRDNTRDDMTNSVPPMSQRQEPEGHSITYTPENDNFISRPDMQQTDRKVPVNELDHNETHEKLVGINDTNAKTVDTDEDLTEFKKKMKQLENFENDADLKKPSEFEDLSKDLKNEIESKGNTSNTEDSFELNSEEIGNKYNVENILYEDDKTTDGEKSVNEGSTTEGSEESFEINSKDIEKVQTLKKSCNDRAICESVDTLQSYEIDENDLQKMKNENHETNDVAERETSFEIDRNNLKQIGTEEIVLAEKSFEDRINTGTLNSSGEASFEINSNEIHNVELNQARDDNEVGDVKSGNEETKEVANKTDGDSRYSPMTSSDKLSETDSGESEES